MNINLNRRERIVITGAAVFIAFFFIINLAVVPMFEKRQTLESELASKRNAVKEMQTLQNDYRALVNQVENARRQYAERSGDFSLFSFMERLAGSSGVKDRIAYMRPGSSVDDFSGLTISQVEMRLEDITTEDLAAYLYEVESSRHMVQVRRLSITKSGEQDGPINVVMRVETAEAS